MLEFFDKMEYSMVVLKSRSYVAHPSPEADVSTTGKGSVGMAQFFHPHPPGFSRKACRSVLAFCWLGGLAFGVALSFRAGFLPSYWMRRAVLAPVSIRRLLCVTGLPFFLSAFAVYACHPLWLWALAFGKGTLLSFVGLAVYSGWGSAGWLVRLLICFGGVAGAPLLYGYWLRHMDLCRGFSFAEAAWLLAAAGVIGSIQYFVIVPFLARLIHF